ncbi:hypothetical protein K353_04709 [Kitasatospora sp. SolWspMP-SS2h]|uniref:hypothetical protein n=1 Tax=Kitasatospora sp. SolWspMP-SS2h TaxID=1305729 RepID=UPI000DBAAB49|nr:hypothetical protein [Kitasatospora sp. SolWspMP-SS2h]RAJ36881.1 hypothetical protein K353_04709 [Kitasatospora sp. SolWspMP-SS2h]
MTDNAPDPGFRLGPVRRRDDPDRTVRLRSAAPQDDLRTVRLRPSVPPPPPPSDVEETVRLDPAVTRPIDLAATLPEPGGPASEGELRRYGPGVPPGAAAVWRGEAVAAAPPPRRWDRWLLVPLVLLLALLGYLLRERYGRPVEVVGVTAVTASAGPGCDGTAVVTGTLETDGGAGRVTYRWLRNDGTVSGPFVQHVAAGHRRTDVTLEWSFRGHGEFAAGARLEVLEGAGGSGHHAEAAFVYACP